MLKLFTLGPRRHVNYCVAKCTTPRENIMLASELDGMHQDGSFSHVMARTAAESLTFDETRHLASRTALVPKTWPPRLGHLIGPNFGKLEAT